MRFFEIAIATALISFPLFSQDQGEHIPWTPAFLSVRSAVAVDQLHASPKHSSPQHQGRCSLSGSPLINWSFDVNAMAASVKTPKIAVRGERQLLCDLSGDPVALTGAVSGVLTSSHRAKNPIFFEMASKSMEASLGIGKHVVNEPAYYVQLFSYLSGGVGSHGCRYTTLEVGCNQVVAKRHTFLFSLEFLKSFPHGSHRFEGLATERFEATSIGCWYRYLLDSGVEASIGGMRRFVHSRRLSASLEIQVQLAIPISL